MSEIQIRVANAGDIDAMTELDAICFSSPWSRASFEAELTTNRLAWYLVAEDAKAGIIGYAGLWAIEDEGHITNVAVHPDYRRKHLGSILVGMLIDQTQKEGLKRFTLEVRVSNQPAIELYEKFGFVSAGIRKGYYEDNNEDAMIMWMEAEEDPKEDPEEDPIDCLAEGTEEV